MLGALIGDIVGSIYEWDNHRSKDFPLFGPRCDYTDDSVCTVALADALLTGADPARHLQAWCRRHPGRGYGGMFGQWIHEPAPRPYSSNGNGAAMPVSAAGWLADRITAITHNHPEGLKGARATAHAILRATGFEDALRNAISIGGDSDTVAAIAGSVAEALFGIPADIAQTARSYLPVDMLEVLERFEVAKGKGRAERRSYRRSYGE